jgi:DNA-directed RNA polymerase subunit M/transcription elongation factor TFIIS
MPIIYGLLLQAKGEVKRVKVSDGQPITMDNLQNAVKKKTALELLATYATKDYTLSLFGYSKGKAGTENKHELPPPNSDLAVFGDILLVACKPGQNWSNPIPFTPDQYEVFYQEQFGGNQGNAEGEDEGGSSDDDEKEEEEEEEPVATSAKKRAAVEDGVPEDEDGGEEEEEEEEEDDEEEDGGAGEDDYDEEVAPKVRAAPKKKPAKPNMTVNQNSGRAKQQGLLMRPGFTELLSVKPIAQTDPLEQKFRNTVMNQIKFLLGNTLTEEQRGQLETSILHNAIKDAETKYVLKHFDNNLFQLCYMSSARRILSNLASTSYVHNTYLLPRLQNGSITIDQLATMTVRDFAPTLYTDLRERQILREQHQLEGNKAMATDMFQCFRCNKRETVFYELQTRSADEPMTKFITCVNCNNRWRM